MFLNGAFFQTTAATTILNTHKKLCYGLWKHKHLMVQPFIWSDWWALLCCFYDKNSLIIQIRLFSKTRWENIQSKVLWLDIAQELEGSFLFFPLDISFLTMSSNSRIWRNKEQTTKHSWDLVILSGQTGGNPLPLLHICWWKPPSFTFTFSFWPPSWTHLEIHILEIM